MPHVNPFAMSAQSEVTMSVWGQEAASSCTVSQRTSAAGFHLCVHWPLLVAGKSAVCVCAPCTDLILTDFNFNPLSLTCCLLRDDRRRLYYKYMHSVCVGLCQMTSQVWSGRDTSKSSQEQSFDSMINGSKVLKIETVASAVCTFPTQPTSSFYRSVLYDMLTLGILPVLVTHTKPTCGGAKWEACHENCGGEDIRLQTLTAARQ